ncbi:MAG: trigger factor [Paludibacter sp.]|jgi:trigger factor|nr:trigger factor [Paludibacter sp.]
MNIVRKDIDQCNAAITLQIAKADYEPNVEKQLREYRKKANVPGFRPGMVPAGMLRKMYGKSIVAEEINKLLSDNLSKYINENKLEVLGEPLPNRDEQQDIDFETQEDFEFTFDVALVPQFEVELTSDDKVVFYQIAANAEMIETQIKSHTSRYGKYVQEETAELSDMIKGTIEELENGEPKEGGIKLSDAVMTPAYFKNEDEKQKFAAAAKSAAIDFNPAKAFESQAELASLLKLKKEDVQDLTSDFRFTIEGITRYYNAEINQELFDKVYGEGTVKSEEEFRQKIKESLDLSLEADSNYRFGVDARQVILEKYNAVEYPADFLKRWVKISNEKLSEEEIEKNFSKMLDTLKWQIIVSKIMKSNELTVSDEEIRQYAKKVAASQFAQYGIYNPEEEYITHFAEDMLKKEETVQNLADRLSENKVLDVIKSKVTLDTKEISVEEFNKLFEEK